MRYFGKFDNIKDTLELERQWKTYGILSLRKGVRPVSNLSGAFKHAAKVGAFIVGSSVIPALLAFYQGNVYWLAAAPALNILAAFLLKWSQLKKG